MPWFNSASRIQSDWTLSPSIWASLLTPTFSLVLGLVPYDATPQLALSRNRGSAIEILHYISWSATAISLLNLEMLQAFHSRPSLFTLDKDVKDRKSIIRTAISEKQETSSTADDEVDLQGLTEYDNFHYHYFNNRLSSCQYNDPT